MFQSLFQWISHWNPTGLLSSASNIKFQSLFQWISHWNIIEYIWQLVNTFCFNPYFSGSVTGTYPQETLDLIKESFNPYFSGSVTGTKCLPMFIQTFSSFNPYFSGSVTGTGGSLIGNFCRKTVSILILVDQSLELGLITTQKVITMFQSLFQWISHWNLAANQCLATVVSSFNPYFSGSVTGTVNYVSCYKIPASFNPYFSGSVTGTE